MDIVNLDEARELGLKRYYTGKPCKYGHITERQTSDKKCFGCKREKNTKYRKEKPDMGIEAQRIWRIENRDRAREAQKAWMIKNKDRHNEWKRIWSKSPHGRATTFMRSSLRRILKDQDKRGNIRGAVGYSQQDLITHLERQFTKGMTWENYGFTGWHIDHIVPVSKFLKQGIKDPSIINALSNLRPLWSKENIQKGASDLMLL